MCVKLDAKIAPMTRPPVVVMGTTIPATERKPLQKLVVAVGVVDVIGGGRLGGRKFDGRLGGRFVVASSSSSSPDEVSASFSCVVPVNFISKKKNGKRKKKLSVKLFFQLIKKSNIHITYPCQV